MKDIDDDDSEDFFESLDRDVQKGWDKLKYEEKKKVDREIRRRVRNDSRKVDRDSKVEKTKDVLIVLFWIVVFSILILLTIKYPSNTESSSWFRWVKDW